MESNELGIVKERDHFGRTCVAYGDFVRNDYGFFLGYFPANEADKDQIEVDDDFVHRVVFG
jgi:hypothetical protein